MQAGDVRLPNVQEGAEHGRTATLHYIWTPQYLFKSLIFLRAYLVLILRPLSDAVHVSGCGELGYCKTTKVFSTKIYFHTIHESFFRNLLHRNFCTH